jgi:hypothetical protein
MNDYDIEYKYNMTKKTCSIFKYLNKKNDEWIIMTLRNLSLKGWIKPHITFLIFGGS